MQERGKKERRRSVAKDQSGSNSNRTRKPQQHERDLCHEGGSERERERDIERRRMRDGGLCENEREMWVRELERKLD